jgi:signal transduction histidine kinase
MTRWFLTCFVHSLRRNALACCVAALFLPHMAELHAQQRLGRSVQQLPPFADSALHAGIGEILLQMDRFSAEGSMAAIGRAFRMIDPEVDTEATFYLLCFRAEVLYYEGLFHEGIADLDRAEALARRLGDSLLIANVFNLKGLLHENIQENRSALPLLRKAVAWFPQRPAARYPVSELHHVHGNMGSYLTGLGAWDSAGWHLQRSLDLALQADAPRAVAVAWWSLGNLALKEQLADSALRCYDRSADVADAMKDHDIGVDALVGRAAALAAMGRREAMAHAVEAAKQYLTTHEAGIGMVTQRNAHRRLARVWQGIAGHEQALDHMARWHRIDSSISKSNIRKALEIQSAKLRADADLAVERLERERSQEALERVRWSRNLIIGASVLGAMLLLAAYLVIRSRQRARQRMTELEVLRLQQEQVIAELRIREEVGRDMHDDLGAGLSALKLRSEMALRREVDPERRELWQFLASTAGELMVNMRQMIWTLNHDQSSLEDLLVYSSNQARNYLDAHGMGFRLELPQHVPEMQLSASQRRNLLMVIKEALHNCVKHANATTVRMVVNVTHDGLHIVLEDNGIGLPRHANQGEGNGLRNMARRMHVIGGTFEAVSGAPDTGRGTTLHLHMPFADRANKGSIAANSAAT